MRLHEVTIMGFLHVLGMGVALLAGAMMPAPGFDALPAASPGHQRPRAVAQDGRTPEATSLFGEPLYAPTPTGEQRTRLEADLAEARAAYDRAPTDAEAIVWLGRRLAYLGRFREAIAVYSKGLDLHPDEPRLYRHRGHRFITVREFGRAVADLEKAAALVAGRPDEIEPDGAPNAFNRPRSTLQSNIWYHLGLARYLQGDFEADLEAYLVCLQVSKNDDMLVATSDWLYMTYRRLGRVREAGEVLAPIHGDMEILENTAYHRRLLLYKGVLAPEDVLAADATDAVQIATQGYGVGNWYLYTGETRTARALFEKILTGSSWQAFGYIAAEADLERGF